MSPVRISPVALIHAAPAVVRTAQRAGFRGRPPCVRPERRRHRSSAAPTATVARGGVSAFPSGKRCEIN